MRTDGCARGGDTGGGYAGSGDENVEAGEADTTAKRSQPWKIGSLFCELGKL